MVLLSRESIDALYKDIGQALGTVEEIQPGKVLPYSAVVYTDVVYAKAVEYGTRPIVSENIAPDAKSMCADKDNKQF